MDDMADACVFLMENYDGEEHINIGTGEEISIKDLAQFVKKIVDFDGELVFDNSMPDGTPKKLTDVSKLHNLGWKHKVKLNKGIELSYEWYKKNFDEIGI